MSSLDGPVHTPAQLPILSPAGGANQIRVRAYNERLVLSLVRLYGSQSKADIARRTGLSAQTVSVIMRALEKEGLLSRGEPVRGRVGQPSIPMRLNPDAGLLVRREDRPAQRRPGADGFRWERSGCSCTRPMPIRCPTLSWILSHQGIQRTGKPARREAAQPHCRPRHRRALRALELGRGGGFAKGRDGCLARFRSADRDCCAGILPRVPAERRDQRLRRGTGVRYRPVLSDFVYFFIGSFIGGGIVLNSAIFSGAHGYGWCHRPAASPRQERRDAAAARSRVHLRAGKHAARARARPAASVVFRRRLDRFRRASGDVDPGHCSSARPGNRRSRLDH